MLKKLKNTILKDLKDINSVGLISDKEKDVYTDILESVDRDMLLLVRSQIFETAQNNIDALHDIDVVGMIIIQIQGDKASLKNFIEITLEEEPFRAFTLKGFDIYKIYKRKISHTFSHTAIRINTVYHAVLRIEYNGKDYSFGFNPAQMTLSFTANNGPIKYFKIVSFDMAEVPEDVKEAIANVVDISWGSAN